MNALQKLFTRFAPEDWARSMEAESRSWIARCCCGHERSIWEMGGMRWKAAGNPKRYMRCPKCGQASWHQIFKRIQ